MFLVQHFTFVNKLSTNVLNFVVMRYHQRTCVPHQLLSTLTYNTSQVQYNTQDIDKPGDNIITVPTLCLLTVRRVFQVRKNLYQCQAGTVRKVYRRSLTFESKRKQPRSIGRNLCSGPLPISSRLYLCVCVCDLGFSSTRGFARSLSLSLSSDVERLNR